MADSTETDKQKKAELLQKQIDAYMRRHGKRAKKPVATGPKIIRRRHYET